MNIPKNEIVEKKYAGETGTGQGIVYVNTIGGLHAFFTKTENGQVESIAASPHKAISMWMAEKKDPDIKWDNGLMNDEPTIMEKSEQALFEKLRDTFYCPHLNLEKSEKTSTYMIYDWKAAQIQICDKEEVKEMLAAKELKGHELVRPADLSRFSVMVKHMPKEWLDV